MVYKEVILRKLFEIYERFQPSNSSPTSSSTYSGESAAGSSDYGVRRRMKEKQLVIDISQEVTNPAHELL